MMFSPYSFNRRARTCLLSLVHSCNSRRFTLCQVVQCVSADSNECCCCFVLLSRVVREYGGQCQLCQDNTYRKACINTCALPPVGHWREAQRRSVNSTQAQPKRSRRHFDHRQDFRELHTTHRLTLAHKSRREPMQSATQQLMSCIDSPAHSQATTREQVQLVSMRASLAECCLLPPRLVTENHARPCPPDQD